MSGKIPIPLSVGARQMLGQVRRTGTFAGVKASSEDVKNAYRLLYAKYGPNEADKFATGWRGEHSASSVMQDAKYGYDEVDYPRGAERLPPGALSDDARRVAKAAAIRARRNKGSKGGMR